MAERIAQNLAFINWTVLTGLAVGSLATVVLARLATAASRGFLGFTALCAAGFGALAYLSDGSLPAVAPDAVFHPDPAFDAPRRALLLVFALLALVYAIALFGGRRAAGLGLGALVVGVVAIGWAALGWGGGFPTAVPLALQLAVLAAATGGGFAAMVLGHWYLVTPRLPEAPLVLIARLLLGVVGLQVVLFAVWEAVGTGGGGPFQPLVGPWALFVWLRLLVGLLFPLVISWAALQTASSRSMESATGLLYIDLGSIAAGTILAAGLYFGAGLLV